MKYSEYLGSSAAALCTSISSGLWCGKNHLHKKMRRPPRISGRALFCCRELGQCI